MTLADAERAIEELSETDDDLGAMSKPELAENLIRLEALARQVGILRDACETELLSLWESDAMVETPLGPVTRKWVSKRWVRWDSLGLNLAATNLVLREVADDDADAHRTVQRTLDMVGRLFRIGGSSARPTELRNAGLNPDEYAESVAGRYVVTVVK